jgi:hypothetical protein
MDNWEVVIISFKINFMSIFLEKVEWYKFHVDNSRQKRFHFKKWFFQNMVILKKPIWGTIHEQRQSIVDKKGMWVGKVSIHQEHFNITRHKLNTEIKIW